MTLLLLVAVPFVFGALCLVVPSGSLRLGALVAGAIGHLAVIVHSWPVNESPGLSDSLALDPLGHLLLSFISVLFAATSIYLVGYHHKRLVSERVFLACIMGLLSALSVVCMSQHLGLLWVSMEAASLFATPLIYFRLGARALEATWKFVLMNSVGIALALLGILCIGISTTGHTHVVHLTVLNLADHAKTLDPVWLRAGFLLALIGFGTKMGLAPLHSWKPDAYGESPPPVAALLAGGMTLGAFGGILRIVQVCAAAGLGTFAGNWLIAFGLLSIAVAAIFIVGNNDYRRLLAYTSVEHMGVLVIGVGLGVAGSYASMLHAMHNTLNKGAMFFLAGFLWRQYGTNQISQVRGSLVRNPLAGVLLLAAICATCALPPFGMFFSELGIILAAAQNGRWWVLGCFVAGLVVVFVGVMTAMLPMVFGEPSDTDTTASQNPTERWRRTTMLAATSVLIALSLGLGAYQPKAVRDALQQAAECVSNPGQVSVASATGSEVLP